MFTGLIEEIGKIDSVLKMAKSAEITIKAQKVLQDIKIGDSISVNGICLTAASFGGEAFTASVMPETLRRTNLGTLSKGSCVNLERAMRPSDRFGGHIVSGHIDGTGTVKAYEKEDNAVWITIAAPVDILKYIIQKGSVCVDGVSLTVAYVDDRIFKVSVIPHTRQMTTLTEKKIGDLINVECDIVGKYVERLMGKQEVGRDFGLILEQNGFF